jgi:hypothetical protein
VKGIGCGGALGPENKSDQVETMGWSSHVGTVGRPMAVMACFRPGKWIAGPKICPSGRPWWGGSGSMVGRSKAGACSSGSVGR